MAVKFNAKKAYEQLKAGNRVYDEEKHCVMVLEVLNNPKQGTISAFCKEAGITDSCFYKWKSKFPIFNDCYRFGTILSKENWESEGLAGKDDPEFNLEYWRIIGSARYGLGKTNRVRIEVDENSNPYEQYKQLISQANMGDFTASEIKQLMESINVGTRTYESFELQKAVDQMKADLVEMEKNRGNNSVSIENTAKKD